MNLPLPSREGKQLTARSGKPSIALIWTTRGLSTRMSFEKRSSRLQLDEGTVNRAVWLHEPWHRAWTSFLVLHRLHRTILHSFFERLKRIVKGVLATKTSGKHIWPKSWGHERWQVFEERLQRQLGPGALNPRPLESKAGQLGSSR